MLNYAVDPQVITPLVPAKLKSIWKTALRDVCSEYRVEHPRWKTWNATGFEFKADVATLYGEQFTAVLNEPPRSAFVADGSP